MNAVPHHRARGQRVSCSTSRRATSDGSRSATPAGSSRHSTSRPGSTTRPSRTTSRCPPTCGISRATSSARRSRRATSRTRRRTAGRPTAPGTSSRPCASTTARRRSTGCERTVLGATVEKRLTLRRGHPFLYETHSFVGGEGAVPVANHAMAALPAGGRLAFSPKRRIETPATAARARPGPRAVTPRLSGRDNRSDPRRRCATAASPTSRAIRSPTGMRTLPCWSRRPAHASAGARPRAPTTRDAMLSLKNPHDFPVTFLWWSNGGRDYSPWNGRHIGRARDRGGPLLFAQRPSRLRRRRTPCPRAGIPTALASFRTARRGPQRHRRDRLAGQRGSDRRPSPTRAAAFWSLRGRHANAPCRSTPPSSPGPERGDRQPAATSARATAASR